MTASVSRRAVEPNAGERSIDDLDAAICTLARQMNAETYRLLLLVREFDDRFGWAKWSLRSCAEWLAWRCGLSLSAAREKVRTAHALRTLPAISAAFADGRLSYSKVRALTRVAHEHDEDLLLAYALQATAAQVEERCRQIRNVAPEATDIARLAWERRSLSIARNPSRGTVLISVEVPAEDGEVLAKALDFAVAEGNAAVGVEFASNRDQAANGWRAQQADALVAIAKAYLSDAGEREAASADHYLMIVHVGEKSLRGGAGRSDLPLETIKRLTCDCSLVAVVEDERGVPLDVGRKQRNVSTALKRALWSRDRGCTFPGCCNKRYVDGHHITHWVDGGDTSVDNMTLLCTYHHRLLHEGDFSVRRDQDGELCFRRADGRTIPRSGYRYEDMVDETAEPAECGDELSAEARMTAIVYGRNASAEGRPRAEVRESAAVYRLIPTARAAP